MPVRSRRPSRRSARPLLPALALLTALGAPAAAVAATPDRTVTATPSAPATWQGPVASGQNRAFDPETPETCSKDPATYCDITLVNVDPQGVYQQRPGGVEFSTEGGPGAVDLDLFVYRSDATGALVRRAGARVSRRGLKYARGTKRAEVLNQVGALVGVSGGVTADERVAVPDAEGWYLVVAVYFDMTDAGYAGRVEFYGRDKFPPDVDDPSGLQDVLASDPGRGFRSRSEPHIAQSPKDPNVLVAASKMYNRDPDSLAEYEFKVGTYVSFDRGRSWRDLGQLGTCPAAEAPPESWPDNRCYTDEDPARGGTGPEDAGDPRGTGDVGEEYITSDPWVDFDDQGNAYVMVLDAPPFPTGAGWGMSLHRWTTPSPSDLRRGRSWSRRIPINRYRTPQEQAAFLDDKNTFAVSNAGPDDRDTGPMIACWTRNEPITETTGPQRIVCERSTDGGRTWPHRPQEVSPPEQFLVIGAHVVPDARDENTFYVFWLDYLSGVADGSGTSTIQLAKTTDGGRTWSDAVTVQRFVPIPNVFPRQAFRNLTLPIGAAGPNGELYLSYADYNPLRAFTPDDDGAQADVKVTASRDGGATWTAPVRVNRDATNADQFQQYLRVTPSGQLNVSFFDRRLDAPRPPEHLGNHFIDTWLARSDDGGATWRETRVSHDSWDPEINPPLSPSGQFIGDYQGLVADDCFAIPFVNDTHLANDPGRDPDFDAGLPRSPFQEVFSWLVPNTSAYGGRSGACDANGGDDDGDDDRSRRAPSRAAAARADRAVRRATRAGTRVLRTTPRRELHAIAARDAIVTGR
jgi:hypothetical protein